jgi:hypothetical protein
MKLQRRIDDLLGIEPGYGETIQGQRYLPASSSRRTPTGSRPTRRTGSRRRTRRAALVHRDGVPQPGRAKAATEFRGSASASSRARRAADLEQRRSRRRAQPVDDPRRHAGGPRGQVHHHQVVPHGAWY